MGVPTFFLKIIHNKFYKNVHKGVQHGKVDCDYFFLDYNGIVYNAYENIKKNIEGNNYSKEKIEEMLIIEVIRYTKYLICEVVKPKKMTYISLDGPAPRAKMVQQRSRRFKGPKEKEFIQELKKKFKINSDEYEWDKSANISPGTKFMMKLSDGLVKAMKNKIFNEHNSQMKIILNNGNVPGEGEHKFLNILRQMRSMKSKENDKIYLYGRDADLIVLAVGTHKNNINILREIKSESDSVLRKMYENYTFLELNIDNLSKGFYNEITKNNKEKKYDKIRILNDYIFLTFLVGNDFVPSLPFLKIKKKGLNKMIDIYNEIKKDKDEYLVNYDINKSESPKLNLEFLRDIFEYGAKMEDEWMKNDLQQEIDRSLKGVIDERTLQAEEKLSEFEKIKSRYTHMQVANPNHPLFAKYQEEIRELDFNKDYEEWTQDYYKFYLGIKKENMKEYEEMKKKLVLNYLESLVFTLNYYFVGCPSWQWHYKFRVSPLLFDVYDHLENNKIKVEDIKFELGKPYSPFQQLMLILPPQTSYILPKQLQDIMTNDDLGCSQYYPIDFRLDVTVGGKTQYSEAILPEIDEELLLDVVKKHEKNLNNEEKLRNEIRIKCYGT